MTLNFHTLKHLGVCCFLRHNLAPPRLRSPSYSHSFFSKMNEAGFIIDSSAPGLDKKNGADSLTPSQSHYYCFSSANLWTYSDLFRVSLLDSLDFPRHFFCSVNLRSRLIVVIAVESTRGLCALSFDNMELGLIF
jgi:hypothetical protein